MEVARGIHRLEGDLGERYVCQYLLVGEERTLLVDTGLRDMPRTVIAPFRRRPRDRRRASSPTPTSTTAAGIALMRELAPGARFLCGEADRPWIESNAAMLAGNYRWYEAYGFGPSEEDVAFLEHELGGDAPIDVGLRGGETLRLGPDRRLEVLALPGHTAGHLGLWDAATGTAIVIDAVLADGVYDRAGRRLIPPALLRRRRLRGDDPPPARARSRPPADRALRGHGARRRARVPRPLARLRAGRARRGPRGRARPTCAR